MSIVVRVEMGDQTEDLIQGVLEDPLVEEMINDIERDLKPAAGLASEPITTAAIVTISLAGVAVFARAIDRWLENRKQIESLKIVLEGFKESDHAGKEMADLAAKYREVSIAYGITQLPKK